MSKQLTPEIKSSPMFLFAKVKGLNSREASRFNSLFQSEADFLNLTAKEFSKTILLSYLEFCKEPKIDKSSFLTAIPGTQPDTISVSRSKLVMAYEKQRKAYLKVKEIRLIKNDEVDNLMIQANPYVDNIPSNMTYRMFVLQHILRYISTPVTVN